MPMLVYEVYQTALELQRDVLYVQFYDRARQPCEETIKANAKNDEEADALWKAAIDEWDQYRLNECPELPIRQTVIDWLDSKGIGWTPSVVRGLSWLGGSDYEGDIYIDVPYDTSLPIYQELEAYLENPDGTLRLPCVNFFYVPLEVAKRHEQEFKRGSKSAI